MSLDEGRIPPEWKMAMVVPIFKKGSKSYPSNYRLVSLTPVVSKIFESIVRESMMPHLCSNNLITSHQHRFLPRKSYVTQFLKTSESLDNGNSVDALYLDFKKAFDSVPHTRLLKKLNAYGFRGKLLDWIKSFLTSRKQQVCVNGSYSGWNDVLSGIPQGSVLGPLLFTIYNNDLSSVLKNSVLLFTDDSHTKVFTMIDRLNPSSTLQDIDDINICARWAMEWQLPFNVPKCKILNLGHVFLHHGW